MVSQHAEHHEHAEHAEGNESDEADDADDVAGRDDPGGDDAGDRALSASARTSAEQAALDAVGGGTVTEVEAEDDAGVAYEVEVPTAGTKWDIELDAGFTVVHKTVDD